MPGRRWLGWSVEKSNQTQNVVLQSIALRWWSVEKSSRVAMGGVVGIKEGLTTARLFIADKTCGWWVGVTMVTIKYRGFAKLVTRGLLGGRIFFGVYIHSCMRPSMLLHNFPLSLSP